MNSIRKQLLRWLLIGQLVAVILTSGLTYLYVRGELAHLFDDRLRQLANSVPMFGAYQPPPVSSRLEDDDDFVIQVWQLDGERILHVNRKEGAPALANEGYSTHFSGGMLWRSYALKRADRFVQASQPYSDRVEMTTEVALGAIAPVLVLIAVLGVLVWVGVGPGLRPLDRLTDDIHQRRPNALDPISEENIPQEVQPLVNALNQLLQRLGLALESQRKFIADAAHELRTPLTAVKLQAQLLARTNNDADRKEALDQVRAGTERASHLVHQLLTMARLEPDDWQRPFVAVDLSALLKTVIREHTPAALRKQIDLGISRDAEIVIAGDAESLRVMCSNLVDNAIRYTPEQGQVDVRLFVAENSACLEIEDTGPGIPAAARKQVFERFYRQAPNGELGSGLGLAIVREVVARHRGSVELSAREQGDGLRVIVRLPLQELG